MTSKAAIQPVPATPLPTEVSSARTRPRIPQAEPRRPSRGLLRFFDLYLSLYIPFHFRALRLAAPERFPRDARPLIVCINHPSWWDPLTSILLSRYLLRLADHYAPIDALSLTRYGILGSLGLFPVEQGTPRGAVQFLRAARHILSAPNAVLWLTPQGGFTDVRTRPIVFKPGLASLIKRLDHVTVVPLAYEYTYWNHRRPEILALCGEPLTFTSGHLALQPAPANEATISATLADALATAEDELAALALLRDPQRFHTVMAGETGISWPRALWRHLRAAIRADEYRNDAHSTELATLPHPQNMPHRVSQGASPSAQSPVNFGSTSKP